MTNTPNIDKQEVSKFEELASRWWDPESEFKPLHQINPLRLGYITRLTSLTNKRVLDIGCGGGILSESMAAAGAEVLGIDAGEAPIQVAKLHSLETGINLDYRQITAEALTEEFTEHFDVITCMEMLEHVPDPSSILKACQQMLKPGGDLFVSTINRNPKSFLFAIVGAEYILNLLPKGTHDYSKLIKPSEMTRWGREAGLEWCEYVGMIYNPLTKAFSLKDSDISVNYIGHFKKDAE